MELTIYVKKIVRAMIIAVLLITLASFVASSSEHSTPIPLCRSRVRA